MQQPPWVEFQMYPQGYTYPVQYNQIPVAYPTYQYQTYTAYPQ